MIVLFEGFDRVGKTIIAKELSKRLNIPYFKKPNDSDSLSGSYNAEMSLIYETRKFIEFLDAGVIENIIIDRDYVSEYVYGGLFRKEIFDKYEIEKYIKRYDELLFFHRIIIVYCYKEKMNNFNDKHITQDKQIDVHNRYLYFIHKTFNRVILVNTEDEDLSNQITLINEFIERINKIDRYNKMIYDDYSIDKKRIFFPGSFIGNDILFVGQNPGYPLKGDYKGEILHTRKYKNYTSFLLEHEKSYRKSKYFEFISRFSKENFGLISNKQFSFTNLVKYSKVNNEALTQKEIKESLEILRNQIAFFKPKKIITFGKDADEALNKFKIRHEAYYHPARYNYLKTEEIK